MMKSRNLFLKIYKKVDDRQTNIQDLRIYATSHRIKMKTVNGKKTSNFMFDTFILNFQEKGQKAKLNCISLEDVL